MQLFDWFYRQRVTEGEMDAAFGAAQTALMTLRATQAKGVWLGDWFGDPPLLAPKEAGPHAPENMTVDIPGPLRAWDVDGYFLYDSDLLINIDCSEDYQGTPTAVLLNVNEKYITVCAVFDWVLSDPRVDGNGDTVYYQRDPGVVYEVYQGAEALIGAAVKPSVPTDRVVLCDVLLHWNDTTIAAGDIDLDRFQIIRLGFDGSITLSNDGAFTNFPTTGFSDATGPSVGDALEEVDDWMTGHLDGTGDHHDADTIDYDNAVSGLAATEVQGALDEIDATLDALSAAAALLDDNVRFEGVLVDPSETDSAQTGWIEGKHTTGGLLIEGTPGAAATDFSKLLFSALQDGALDLVQGQNVANTNIFFDVQAFSLNAARIYNGMTAGNPLGLLVSVPNSGPTSFGLHVSVLDGDGHLIDFGGGTSGDQDGISIVSAGGAAGATKTGVHIEEHAGHSNCTSFRGLYVETHSAYYSASSYGARLDNLDAGANGYVGVQIFPRDGTGLYIDTIGDAGDAFYVRVDSGDVFDVDVLGTGAIGVWKVGTDGLEIRSKNGSNYGLDLKADNDGDVLAALVRMTQNGTGKAIDAEADPAQTFFEITSRAVVGAATGRGITIDYSLATSNDPIPFYAKTRTAAGYAYYAEQGFYAAQSDLDTDVFTLGVQDDAAQWEEIEWQAKLAGAWTGVACDYVELNRDLETPANLVQRDAVSKRRIATAWAQVKDDGTLVGGHFNVLTATRTATGVYELTLDVNGTPTGRSVQVTTSTRGNAAEMHSATVVDPLTNPIVVKIQSVIDSGGGSCAVALINEDFTFTVFQDR